MHALRCACAQQPAWPPRPSKPLPSANPATPVPSAGSDPGLYWRNARNSFQFYASGRRHCDGVLTTLDLRSRQDLLAGHLWNLYSPSKDALCIEVFMHEGIMPQVLRPG